MQITIIQIGKTKHKFFQEAENEYLKRLQVFAKIKVLTLKEAILAHADREAEIEKVKLKEAEEISANIPKDTFLFTLDENGQQFTSKTFAKLLEEKKDFGQPNLTFIIGGPYGLHESLIKKANLHLSFSKFTFTHEAIRTLLLEQLYRAFTIIQGKTYHY